MAQDDTTQARTPRDDGSVDPAEPPRRPVDGRTILQDPTATQTMLAAIVASSDDAIISKDLNGTILTWNAGAERMFGYRGEEVVGKPTTILLPPDRPREEAEILDALREGRRIDHFETERVAKDGRHIRVSLSVAPVRDANGDIVGAAKIARDVSTRHEVHEFRAQLAAIVESSDDAIVGKTLDGIVMTWNAGAEHLFGYRADEIIGRPITTLIPPERLAEEDYVLSTLRAGQRIDHFETERVTKDGRRIEVSISVSPIRNVLGEIVGAAKIARDVTSSKRREREREAALEAERQARASADAANRAKDAFLAMISHELRTPLSPILAWTRMLLQGTLDEAKSQRALETIERNARSQAQLIDDLLDVSRIVAGKLRLEVRPVELTEVIHAAIEVVRPAVDAKGIRLQVTLDTETGTISGDPDRLQQVVWNLLSNAIKFTPKDGRVHVTLERVNSHVGITISDTGQGVAPEFVPHLFERFQQAESGPSRRYGGLGLGLAIVRHIVELHGGSVAAASAGEGQGTTFTIKLPRMIFARTAGETERRHPTVGTRTIETDWPRLDGVRILVVDDEMDSNDVVSTMLMTCGADVRAVASAAAALDTLARWTPDLLISDIGMPIEDGYMLLRRVRKLGDDRAWVPAVALTAYATIDDRVRIFSAGFQAHVVKPVDPVELAAVVASTLRRPLAAPRPAS